MTRPLTSPSELGRLPFVERPPANATITGAMVGIRDDGRPKLLDTVLSGNAIDIIAARRPLLVDSTCESSRDLLDAPWGVCTND